jgi:DNA-binding CsgD family transcriptional regulator
LSRAWDLADAGTATWFDVGELLLEVLTVAGGVDDAMAVGRRLVDAADSQADAARFHLAMAGAAASASRWVDASRQIDLARRDMEPGDDPRLDARLDAMAAEVFVGEERFEVALAIAVAALGLAEQHHDHETAARCLLVIGRCGRVGLGDLPDLAFDRAIEISRDHGLPALAMQGLMERASLDLWNFRPSAGVLAARAEAASAGALIAAAHLDNFLAWLAKDRWETDDIEVSADRCAELSRKLHLTTLHGIAIAARAVAAAQRNERDEMSRLAARAASMAEGHPHVAAAAGLAPVYLSIRRDDPSGFRAALANAIELLAQAPQIGGPERGLWALVRVLDGGGDEAITELDGSSGARHLMNQVYREYALGVIAGRAGDLEAASRRFACGDAMVQPLGLFQHHARRLMAEPALESDWGEPLTWLREALVEFDARGHEQAAARCRALLTEAGAPAPRRTRLDAGVPSDLQPSGVTAREFEVLERLGNAESTKAIAAALFLSPKTVERHISNLAMKLDVDGRAALVAFAASRAAHRPSSTAGES